MTALCNLNGVILPEADATVSVLDRGFLFGDSVYEVMRTRDGVPFAWPEHLERLRESAAGIALDVRLDDTEILRRIKATLLAEPRSEAYVRLIVTRGVGTAPNIGLAHAPGPPTWIVLVRDLAPAPRGGARLALIPRLRNDRRALDPAIKSGNYLNNLLGLAEANERGATDCLFLNQAGMLTEASTSNFYLVRNGRIETPPLSAGLLRGTTRRLLFAYCEGAGIEMVERELGAADLQRADEMFLSSTLRDVHPVTEVDGKPVQNGEPGPLTQRLMTGFDAFCEQRTRELYAPPFAAID